MRSIVVCLFVHCGWWGVEESVGRGSSVSGTSPYSLRGEEGQTEAGQINKGTVTLTLWLAHSGGNNAEYYCVLWQYARECTKWRERLTGRWAI